MGGYIYYGPHVSVNQDRLHVAATNSFELRQSRCWALIVQTMIATTVGRVIELYCTVFSLVEWFAFYSLEIANSDLLLRDALHRDLS